MYLKFRKLNEKICLSLAYPFFISRMQDAEFAYSKYPYAWLFLLIPIAGIGFFILPGENAYFARKYQELQERRKKLL